MAPFFHLKYFIVEGKEQDLARDKKTLFWNFEKNIVRNTSECHALSGCD